MATSMRARMAPNTRTLEAAGRATRAAAGIMFRSQAARVTREAILPLPRVGEDRKRAAGHQPSVGAVGITGRQVIVGGQAEVVVVAGEVVLAAVASGAEPTTRSS